MSFANEKANHAIECHVTQCNNHCGCEDYCTLDKVCIGTHEADQAKIPLLVERDLFYFTTCS